MTTLRIASSGYLAEHRRYTMSVATDGWCVYRNTAVIHTSAVTPGTISTSTPATTTIGTSTNDESIIYTH